MNEQTREILIILQEECAEIIQDVAKCFRFGPDQIRLNSTDGRTQIQNLEREIGDVMAMIDLLINEGVGVTIEGIDLAKRQKFEKLKLWSSIQITELKNENYT
jgi:NTP pyrophosphatase (non-canonical NTP hydrolase)